MQDVPRAREIVRRFGWNATAYQILNPGIEHWFSARGDAVVGYVRRQGVRVVAGAPICDRRRLAEVLREFEKTAPSLRERACYFGAAGRVNELLRADGAYSMVVLGAQPTWNPQEWAATIDSHASLRAQLYRARNKGVTVAEWPRQRAEGHPDLQRCLDEWLSTRPLPPLHFLVEPETLTRLLDRRVFVAERVGVPVGFVVLSPVPCRNGWLTEQFVRGQDAPNGTVETTIDAAVRAVAAEGADYVTLGLSPLSRHTAGRSDTVNPLWLRFVLAWVRAHGRRFYNFDGLDRFKAKFHPHAWEPIYVFSRERRFSSRTLYAIADAFTEGPPLTAVGRSLLRALRQEYRWLAGRLRPRHARRPSP